MSISLRYTKENRENNRIHDVKLEIQDSESEMKSEMKSKR